MARPVKLNSEREREVLALYKRLKISEIAARYGVSGGTITRILHRHGAMPPRYATEHEQAIIRRQSGKRTQIQIAEFLGRSLSFVTFWQRRQKFRACAKLNAALENQIIALYRGRGLGQARVGREINVSEKVVHQVLVSHGIPLRKAGGVPILTPEKRQQAVAMIRAKNSYLKDIAKKLGVHRGCVEKLAHAVLGCERFFGGPLWPPLQSAFPEMQRHDERCTVGDYMKLLNAIFPTGLPPSAPDSTVVPVVIDLLMTTFPFWRTASTPVLENLENHLVTALATMRGAEQTSLVN